MPQIALDHRWKSRFWSKVVLIHFAYIQSIVVTANCISVPIYCI